MVSASANAAYGLDPSRALSQFVREEWGVERGFVGGVVRAIAETPDGYLWLGTEQGLVRFDGTTFTLVPESVSASGAAVVDLAVDASGDLWIRRQSPTVQRLSKGRFENALSSLSPIEEFVMSIARGRNGTVLYAGRFHGIGRFANKRFQSIASWSAEDPVQTMVEASDGRVWLGTEGSGLFSVVDGRVTPGPGDLARDTIEAVSEAPDQSLWVATLRGVRRWDRRGSTTEAAPAELRRLHVLCMLRDRDANVWLGTTEGLVRIGSDGAVAFDRDAARSGAVTAGAVTTLFEDREGTLWIGGATGIARLRQGAFTAYARAEGLPADRVGPVHGDVEGRTWFAPVEGGLYWLQRGRVGRVTAAGLDRDVVYAIAGGAGEIWVGRRQQGLTRLRVAGSSLQAATFTNRDGLARGSIVTVHRSRDGAIWAGTLGAGASVRRAGDAGFTTYTAGNGLASNIVTSIGETMDGTVWLATPQGVSALVGGRWRTYGVADGLPSNAINCVLGSAADASLWVGTAAGLVRIADGRVLTNVLPNVLRNQIFGLAEDDKGSLWVATSSRLLQVSLDPLRRGQLREEDIREFEKADGLRSAESTRRERSLTHGPDGRIWLSTTQGLAVVDPARLPPRIPPTAAVRTISVDGEPLDLFAAPPLRIRSNPERLAFGLVGISLSFPQQVRLRYRLEGIDRNWSAETTAPEAIYTRLGPGAYTFRVMSSTGDGRWQESEAPIALVVESAFWQTSWFQLLLASTCGVLAFAAYRLRTRQLTGQLKIRFEERLAERTRIAQELHDTLLQGVLGASMRLHSAVDDLPADTPTANREELERVLLMMSRVSDEGRVAVRGLRTESGDDLEQALCLVHQEYASRNSADFKVTVEGRVRTLHPLIRDEVYRIGREALVNAFRHARANKIEIELEYDSQHLRMVVRDDGCGMAPNILRAGRDGHWGLSGMRERALHIGGQLTLSSRAASGTEVELLLPASVAFTPLRGARP